MVKLYDRRGAVSIAEYILLFALVLAVLGTMTLFMQRAFQARMRDARYYAMNNFRNECNAFTNCVGRGALPEQYEPYYTQINAQATRDSVKHKRISGPQTMADSRANNDNDYLMNQLPPKDAINDRGLGAR